MSNAKLGKHHSSPNVMDDTLNKYKPIDIGAQIERILRELKPHLKWYRDKNQKWCMVHAHEQPEYIKTAEIMLPNTHKIKIESQKLQTKRKGLNDRNNNDIGNYTLLKDLINTIDELYKSIYKDTKIKIIKSLQEELKQQKIQNMKLKKEETKRWNKKMAAKEKEMDQKMEELTTRYLSTQRELKLKNKELGQDIDKLTQMNKHLQKQMKQLNEQQKVPIQPKDENIIETLKKDCDAFKQEITKLKKENNKLNGEITAKDFDLNILKAKLNALEGETDMDFAPDMIEEEEPVQQQEQKEEKKEAENINKIALNKMLPVASNVSESKSMSAMASLNEFGHKYSPKNLAKCDRQQLIDMIVSLYLSNQKFKQELRENILGVGSENTFLNIDEILNKYVTLRTQTHNNLYNNLLDALEEKYENENDDDINEEELEKQSYNILFHILNLSNDKISKEFNDLYMKIAKIIKINKQKNPIKLVSNVLHSTLQTYYKQLIDTVMDEEEEKENANENVLFDVSNISKTIYEKLLVKFSGCDKLLKSVEKDVINYIKCCLEMVVIIQLNKPKLHFIHLKEFENITHEKFDDNKHEKCNFDYDEYNERELQLTQPKYIQYYCFPGLSIENNINIKGGKKKKKKKGKKENDETKCVTICKTQIVC